MTTDEKKDDGDGSKEWMRELHTDPTVGLSKAKPAKKLPVMEFFGPTLQGEGSVAGMPTYFLRMGGCDYRCKRCDSMHAVLPELIKQNATSMTQEEIFDMITMATHHPTIEDMGRKERTANSRKTDAITISGGNPLMWDLTDLVQWLTLANWKVYVETQGTIWRDWLRYCDVTVSPKGPGMGETFELNKFTKFITQCLKHGILPTTKVVVFNQQDVELMADILSNFPALSEKAYFSIGNVNPPAPAERDSEHELSRTDFVMTVLNRYRVIAEEILNDPRPVIRNVRILPQIHTLLWQNDKGR